MHTFGGTYLISPDKLLFDITEKTNLIGFISTIFFQGTTKPTYYVKLYDDNNLTADQEQGTFLITFRL